MLRVLVVKLSALGDLVNTLPVLDFLHQSVPGIEIDWVVEESFREILEGNPLIARLHLVRPQEWRNRPLQLSVWREVSEARDALRERSYDIVFDLEGNLNSGIIARLSGCPRQYGFDRDTVRDPLNTKFIGIQVPLRRRDHHVIDRSLRLVSVPFGKDYAGYTLKAEIHTSQEDDAAAEVFLAILSDGLVFVLHHGTGLKTKLWYESGWIELGKRLLEKFPDGTILLSWGDQKEYLTAEHIAAGIGRQTRILPQLTLKAFTALMKKVDLLVAGDTGPLHIAAVTGLPTVSFYRATDAKRTGPRGDNHRHVQSPLSCTRCLKSDCERDAECRQSITVERMMLSCVELLSSGVLP